MVLCFSTENAKDGPATFTGRLNFQAKDDKADPNQSQLLGRFYPHDPDTRMQACGDLTFSQFQPSR
jgi:hypothetical protein